LPIPRGGTISDFFFQSFVGANIGITVVLRVNGVDTAISCVTNSTFGCGDKTDTVTVVEGDKITVDVTANTGKPGLWGAQLH
jgi:hypothetical protein